MYSLAPGCSTTRRTFCAVRSHGDCRRPPKQLSLCPLQRHDPWISSRVKAWATTAAVASTLPILTPELASQEWDAIVVGSGVGGLTAATEMAANGAKVLVLEKYIIPGGSAGQFERKGYRFDVGSSMMFGLSKKPCGTNLITQALEHVGKSIDIIPDPTQLEYHLPKSERFPNGLNIKVWCDYERFLEEMFRLFPHEEEGIKGFYGECWREPLSCLTLASYFITNTGQTARKHIKDPELLKVIDIECFCWSTVLADATPLINAGMVLCDRFYGGINYPRGGVGGIARLLVEGLQERGGAIAYKAGVDRILTEGEGPEMRAVGVRLKSGTEIFGKCVVSNATRWDTFGRLIPFVPENEAKFRKRYVKSPSFITLHLGIKAGILPEGTECHHIVVEDWAKMENPRGCLFVSIPSILDESLAPKGHHTFHAFAPEFIVEYQGLSAKEYQALKEKHADEIIDHLEAAAFPGLRDAIVFREVGSPRTHQKFLNREDGTYGPVPLRPPMGILNMPFNTTDIKNLYCAGDSTFPGQGVNAVVFSGFGAAHRALVDQGKVKTWPLADELFRAALRALRYNT